MRKQAVWRDLMAVAVAAFVIILSQFYVFEVPTYDYTTFLVGVALPLLSGSIVFLARGRRVLFFAFFAYIWSLVDDAPVNFDSALTWPEVTRFHPAEPHIFLEILLHALTAVFLYLTVREALKGTVISKQKAFKVSFLTLLAFLLSYAQNIPLNVVQVLVSDRWYQLDAIEHAASILFLYFAIREARKIITSPDAAGLG